MANTNLTLTSLDPNSLKAQQQAWLQNNSIYLDYNYDGSNMNVILDIMARNTFLNSFYLNMAFSEAFNDSCVLRDSIVSKAKELNYIPYSMQSSSTTVNVNIQTANLTTFELPKGTAFSGLNSNGSFTFVTDQNYVLSASNGYFQFSNVTIYEGFYTADLFSVDTSVNNQLFTLSNPGVDTTSLTIIVSENSGSTNTIFTQAPNLYGLNGNSDVYFLQAASSNTYQFQFGDGVLGYQPQNGAVVTATYRVTNGDVANFINSFVVVTNLGTYNNGSITTLSVSASNNSIGGSQAESVDSIRFNNPRHYSTQNEAISSVDYKTLITDNFPYIKDVNVYAGGVTATAVQYGMIFISLITVDGNPATQTMKNNIQTFIQKLNILNYQVQFVDPDFLYINVSSNVHVDFSQTNIVPNQYKAMVINAISQFSTSNIESYATPFRYSQLGDMIDGLDESILSNETTTTISKYANVTLNTNNLILINYNNPIVNISSTPFLVGANTYYISDNTGLLYLVPQSITSTTNTNFQKVGTVNYTTGNLNIPILNISNYLNGSSIIFTAYPQQKDIYCYQNDIIEIDSVNGLNINIVSD
jgi:hypothetical protein